MFDFYEREGFKLFACNLNKTPRVASWRATESHLSVDGAERLVATGNYVGAWLPPNYVVIDLDRNHGDVDGVASFKQLCEQLDIPIPQTLTIKTGSGGQHLYFTVPQDTDYRTLSQKSIGPAIDIRTHLGYVIGAGTNGYSVVSGEGQMPVRLPPDLLRLIQTRNKDRAQDYRPDRELPLSSLHRVLSKVDVSDFSTNDTWQEFVVSCIAVAGNSDTVLEEIEAWSKQDSTYAGDASIRKRLETFEPVGGITAGTFLHLIKQAGVSKYLIDKVRLFIGAEFSFSEKFIESFDVPFHVDFSIIDEHKDLMASFYYRKHQAAALEVFSTLVEKNFLYSIGDRAFFYFDGNRWIETPGSIQIIFSVLVNAVQRFYTDYSKPKDGDADDLLTGCLNYLGQIATLSRFEHVTKQHSSIVQQEVDWDSERLEATLTLSDSVMDFSKKDRGVFFRKGLREEYRRLHIDLTEASFRDPKIPENFREFLKDVFPDDETRRTATYALSTMLSGTGKFRRFHIWNGAGSNGKSTLMEIMKSTIGERAISYKADILLTKNHVQSLTPELAVFRGALAAFASETEESKRVSQGAVKALTGNETMTANPKYKGMIEFKTTFQLVLSTNYLPAFSAHDNAFINRVLILPFYTNFYKNEEERAQAERRGARYFAEAKSLEPLLARIDAERAEILYYLARRYQELDNDIPESDESKESKRHYVDDNNDIVQFLSEFVEYDSNHGHIYFTPTRDLTDFYNHENNTRYSAKFVIMRLREVFPHVDMASKLLNGKLSRGVRNVRLKYGAFPEGYQGNYTKEEIAAIDTEEAGF